MRTCVPSVRGLDEEPLFEETLFRLNRAAIQYPLECGGDKLGGHQALALWRMRDWVSSGLVAHHTR